MPSEPPGKPNVYYYGHHLVHDILVLIYRKTGVLYLLTTFIQFSIPAVLATNLFVYESGFWLLCLLGSLFSDSMYM